MEKTRLPSVLSESEEARFPKSSYFYKYLHSLEIEEKRRPLPNYMEAIQKEITSVERAILIDWIVEVCQVWDLKSDTLYQTVSYIDRYLSAHSVPRNKFQLLGITSMLIATKDEEICSIDEREFCAITENSCRKDEVIEMEKCVLKVLDEKKGGPTIKTFLRLLTRIAHKNKVDKMHPDKVLKYLSCYLAELSLLEYSCVRFLPSVVAASAIFLAVFILRPTTPPWILELHEAAGYSASELKDCVTLLHKMQSGTTIKPTNAVTQKYSQDRYRDVASLVSLPEVPARYFEN